MFKSFLLVLRMRFLWIGQKNIIKFNEILNKPSQCFMTHNSTGFEPNFLIEIFKIIQTSLSKPVLSKFIQFWQSHGSFIIISKTMLFVLISQCVKKPFYKQFLWIIWNSFRVRKKCNKMIAKYNKRAIKKSFSAVHYEK